MFHDLLFVLSRVVPRLLVPHRIVYQFPRQRGDAARLSVRAHDVLRPLLRKGRPHVDVLDRPFEARHIVLRIAGKPRPCVAPSVDGKQTSDQRNLRQKRARDLTDTGVAEGRWVRARDVVETPGQTRGNAFLRRHRVHDRVPPEAKHAQLDGLPRPRPGRRDRGIVGAHVKADPAGLRPVRVHQLEQDALALRHPREIIPLVHVRVPGRQGVLRHAVAVPEQVLRDVVVRLDGRALVQHAQRVVLDRRRGDVAPQVQVGVALVAAMRRVALGGPLLGFERLQREFVRGDRTGIGMRATAGVALDIGMIVAVVLLRVPEDVM
mmetsp:Transcript_76894/g.128177  ORF Transcript_76894/g.128177 Transcript_76894/m.128177 type:complete len:321 (-) Transcript_76894:434-1396(-)